MPSSTTSPEAGSQIGFGSALDSNPLPIDKALIGVGRYSSPCGGSSRVARLALIDVELGEHEMRNVVPEVEARLVIDP